MQSNEKEEVKTFVSSDKVQPWSIAKVSAEHTVPVWNVDALLDSWKPRAGLGQSNGEEEVKTFVSSDKVQPGSKGGVDLVIDNVLEDLKFCINMPKYDNIS